MTTPIIRNPLDVTVLADWGAIPTMIEERRRRQACSCIKVRTKESECGIWVCTPGKWECHVTRDEFCHFISGRCTYVRDDGEVIEIMPDTAAFFPQDWKGVCTVHETVRKLYMIR